MPSQPSAGPSSTDYSLEVAPYQPRIAQITVLRTHLQYPSGSMADRVGSGPYEDTPLAAAGGRPALAPSFAVSASDESTSTSASTPISPATLAASAGTARPSIVQRRPAQATLPKLLVGCDLLAATALHTALHVDQPRRAAPPSPHSPNRTRPITIPTRRHYGNISHPTTPLTAREEKGSYFSSVYETTPPKPQISQSLRPGYQRSNEREPSLNLASWQKKILPTSTLEQLKELSTFSDTHSMPSDLSYRLPGPLSPIPTPPPSSLSAGLRPLTSSPRGKDMRLPPLPIPRFHPSNYENPTASSTLRSPAVNRSPVAPHHHRHQSDARLMLKQHQRDLITSATRPTNSPIMPGGSKTPRGPHLQPRGSPGPATPLALDEQVDYMTAGLNGTALGEGSSRELVDRMIGYESDRRAGLHSGPSSPAVSPAGGRG